MSKQNIKYKEGFTIIEVVLVLAIAGLIFLMVFVALPALQRSQRDTQRRNDLSRVDTSLVQYQTNNASKTNNLPGAGEWTGAAAFPDNCNTNTAFPGAAWAAWFPDSIRDTSFLQSKYPRLKTPQREYSVPWSFHDRRK